MGNENKITSGKLPQQHARELAEQHVSWLLDIMKPLLITEFEHGYKHGFWDGYGDDGLYLTEDEKKRNG